MDCPAEGLQKRESYSMVLVVIVIKDAVGIAVNRGTYQKLDAVFKVHEVRCIGQESISIAHFIKDADGSILCAAAAAIVKELYIPIGV